MPPCNLGVPPKSMSQILIARRSAPAVREGMFAVAGLPLLEDVEDAFDDIAAFVVLLAGGRWSAPVGPSSFP